MHKKQSRIAATPFQTVAALSATLLMAASQAQVANCPFNVDGTGSVADALRDGTVLVRYARGVRDPVALVAGTGANAATVIAAITANIDRLDINGNGAFDSDDAVVISRVLFGYNTSSAAFAPKGQFAIRDTQNTVKAYLDGGCASTSLADNQRAAKFLQLANFGPSNADINAFNALAPDAAVTGSTLKRKASTWVTNQFNTPRTGSLAPLHFNYLVDYAAERCIPSLTNCQFGANVVRQSFWKQAITGQDQLRQRVAYALSQILVVSDRGPSNDRYELGAYLDFLNNNALGNYRDLLAGVVRSPAMGRFLSHLRNDGSSTTPNENFAREMLQLFSVGQLKLNANGTAVSGNPSTYTEEVVKGFARTFTGLTYDDRRTNQRCLNRTDEPIPNWDWNPDNICYPESDTTQVGDRHGWQRPMVVFPGFHSSAARKLLQYDAVIPGSADPRCAAAVVGPTQNIVSVAQAPTGEGTRVSKATGDLMIDAAVTNIFCHPNVGPFIGKQLIRFFVTSTPSPEYVERVTAAFNNNGSNVRGDMRAVIRSILLDDEALDGAALSASERPKYGKLREPIMRLAHILRAFPRPTAASTPPAPAFSGRYFIDGLDSVEYGLNQGPLQSPSVFNFYHPEFSPPGPVQRANATAPEFEITTTTAIASTQNYFGGLVTRKPYGSANTYADYGMFGSDYVGTCQPENQRYNDCVFMDYGDLNSKWQSADDLFDYINLVLLGGKLPASVKATYVAALDQTYPPNPSPGELAERRRDRVRVALWFAVHAPEFQVQY
ncbi:MAG: DUF1800 family protein [Betaproteobacteria bacterium]|nr:MAG: DUF1800 family protein [Betaproteobacteria bacterium]